MSKGKGCSPMEILWDLQDAPVPGQKIQLQAWAQQCGAGEGKKCGWAGLF